MQRSRISALLALAVLAACSDASVNTAAAPGESELIPLATASAADEVVPGEVLVKLRDGGTLQNLAADHGAAPAGMGHRNAFGVVRGVPGGERALAARLALDPRVEYAEPNYIRHPEAIDPRLWAFFNPGGLTIKFTSGASKGQVVSSAISLADADEDNIEAFAAGGGAVVIGSIDTGVNLSHTEFLPGQLIAGRDWYSNDNNPADDNNHGTHTTGTMAGRTVGIAGVSGAGANVKVYVQRVCGRNGCPTSAIVSAIRAAADYPGMVAMNLSLGGAAISQSERDAIAYANSKNVLVIASAGNGTTSHLAGEMLKSTAQVDAVHTVAGTMPERLHLLTTLASAPAVDAVFVCAAAASPDRGAERFLRQLCSHTHRCALLPLGRGPDGAWIEGDKPGRWSDWLKASELSAVHVCATPAEAAQWLASDAATLPTGTT